MFSTGKKKFLVSLHDVTPVMFERSQQLVEMIMKEVGTAFTMLVVPDFHHQGRLDKYPEFCAWLRDLNNSGVEIAQHGLYHLGGNEKFTLSGKLFTSGEGEFVALNRQEAKSRIETGFSILSDALGSKPVGFTAPAWLYSNETIQVLEELDFDWIEYRWAFQFSRNYNVTVPAIVFASRTPWKRICSRFWATTGPAVFSVNKHFRLALHVRDLPTLEEPVRRVLAGVTRHREVINCADLAHE